MIDTLLARLDAVRPVARGRWRARCPAHDGESRDVLSVAETSDGTVLVRCFHGCSALEIVTACGLQLADLFPGDLQTGTPHCARPARRPRTDWTLLILACERDLLLAAIVLAMIARREPVADDDAAACGAAAQRTLRLIQEARNG